ncbi:pyrroline-5-carboxylate reductase [Desulforhopalus sp. IMCC35007]|uniref:pyrroline-5-carboxylate reductase n=1 Tax=Desulforhopalus sp. IMCC35007 TaxID=2569543 RepID=UPI0010AEC3B5|nr:pyrroline-5-carboxylate reductase [Desulforhopalus sp. IMCC35007]TKB11221.1 pyrroline-5-carboxylate reductase [Desulforhopalus sp. IMCC35007]
MRQKIGFIGGGQMAEALIKGIITSGLYKSEDILVAEPNESRRDHLESIYSVKAHYSNLPVFENCRVIMLAVKPQTMSMLLEDCQDRVQPQHILISIAAGLPISFYIDKLGKPKTKMVRVMPNTPALVLEGASAISRNLNVTDEELRVAEEIFLAVGEVVILDEVHLDAVTGLSGSGPAYVFSFVEALIDAGVKSGLTRAISEKLALQTVSGSVKLLKESGEHPAALRGKVTSPGGTAITALHVLEKVGFHGIIMDIVESAVNRSKELGKG